MPMDPLGPRQGSGFLVGMLAGIVLVPLGLYGGLRYGGWAWAPLPIGMLAVAVQTSVLYLDPFGGPRRGLRGAIAELKAKRKT